MPSCLWIAESSLARLSAAALLMFIVLAAGPATASVQARIERVYVTWDYEPAVLVSVAVQDEEWIGVVGETIPGTNWQVSDIGFLPSRLTLIDVTQAKVLNIVWRDGRPVTDQSALRASDRLPAQVLAHRRLPPPPDPGTPEALCESILELKLEGRHDDADRVRRQLKRTFPAAGGLARILLERAIHAAATRSTNVGTGAAQHSADQGSRIYSVEHEINASGDLVIVPHVTLVRGEHRGAALEEIRPTVRPPQLIEECVDPRSTGSFVSRNDSGLGKAVALSRRLSAVHDGAQEAR